MLYLGQTVTGICVILRLCPEFGNLVDNINPLISPDIEIFFTFNINKFDNQTVYPLTLMGQV